MSTEGKTAVVSSEMLRELDLLLFGVNPEPLDVTRWQSQGFTFSKSIPCGLVQLHGGPCGILAPVQAFVLKFLLFDNAPTLTPDPQQAKAALVSALSFCLAQARSSQNVYVVLGDSLSALQIHTCANPDEVRGVLDARMAMFESPIGVLLFVYSLLLTRGIAVVKSDMDQSEDRELCLVARFGHCSQDLVNLVITGRAVSNVFDNSKSLGGMTLKGIQSQPEIGFLSLLEALRYTKVGEYFKNPKYPIWVVGSASHYTVLFGVMRTIGQLSEAEKIERTAKQAFNELDPEESGFIPTSSLPQALGKLGIVPASMDQANRANDPDSLGVCLWPKFSSYVSTWHQQNQDWSCAACTFINPPARGNCDICNTVKPVSIIVAAPTKTTKPPFELFHYNGIEGHGQASAALCKMTVTPQDMDGLAQGDKVEKQGLREVIRTKWPAAHIVYEGATEPKIV